MAVSIHLKQFDGPLDLLLHLVGKAKIDLADIFVSEITEQYIEIVRGAPDFDMDEASEFIAMAALLVEIKSRRLLPKPPREEEEDPEQALIARLTAYKQFRESARNMAEFEKSALKLFGKLPEEYPLPPPTLELDGLTLEALWQALLRVQDRRPAEPREVDFHAGAGPSGGGNGWSRMKFRRSWKRFSSSLVSRWLWPTWRRRWR